MLEVTRIGTKNYTYFAPLLFETMDKNRQAALPADGQLRIGVIDDGVVCGAASFQVEETTAQLTSIYVAEAYRHRGAAAALLDTFVELAKNAGITALTTSVSGEDETMQGFLREQGFELFDSAAVYSFTFEDVCNAKALLSEMKRSLQQRKENWLEVLAIGQLQPYQMMELERYISAQKLGSGWLKQGTFSLKLSFVVMDIKKKPLAFMICSEQADRISIDLLYSANKTPAVLMLLFADLYAALKKREDQSLMLTFLAENQRIEAFVQQLFGEQLKQIGRQKYAVRQIQTR